MTILPLSRNTIKLASASDAPVWSIGDDSSSPFKTFLSHNTCPYYVLIQNIEYEDNDVVLPIVAVDDARVLYGFGKDFGKLFITGLLCIPTSEVSDENGRKQTTNLIDELNTAFNKTRSTATAKPVNISGAMGFKTKAYIIGMKLHSANPQSNTIQFTLTGLVAPVSNNE